MAEEIEGKFTNKLLETPRTKSACKKVGIDPKELTVKNLKDFKEPGLSEEQHRVLFNHYENKRQQKLNLVLEERNKIIEDEINNETEQNFFATKNLHMIEFLISKEAKKLEKELKQQLRYHQAIEIENQQQIQAEENLKKRIEYRNSCQSHAKKLIEQKVVSLKSQLAQKIKSHKERIGEIRSQFENLHADCAAHQLEEELRLQEWLKVKDSNLNKKNEKWQIKKQFLEKRQNEVQMEKEIRGHQFLTRHDNKIFILEQKRQKIERQRKVKAVEKNLKIIDAKEKQKRLQKIDENRREIIRRHLNELEERTATLESLKEQLLRERQFRIKQRSVLKGKPLNIKNLTPGPAHYEIKIDSVNENPAPKISTVKPVLKIPGSLDLMVQLAKEVPPPGTYDPKKLPDGNDLWSDGKISMSKSEKKTYLDFVRTLKKDLPGPGTYETKTPQNTKGVKIVRDYVFHQKNDEKNGGPGPAAYNVDKFLKYEEKLKNANYLKTLQKVLGLSKTLKKTTSKNPLKI